jgi:hypothetical protein
LEVGRNVTSLWEPTNENYEIEVAEEDCIQIEKRDGLCALIKPLQMEEDILTWEQMDLWRWNEF